jgi:hypothetical protein
MLLLWVELWPFQENPVVQNLEEASDSKLCLRRAPPDRLWGSYAPAFPANASTTAVFNFHGPLHWVMRAALATFVRGTPFGTSAKVWNCFAEGSS